MINLGFTQNQQLYTRVDNLLDKRAQDLRAEYQDMRNANADAREALSVAINATKGVHEANISFAKQAGEFMTTAQEYAEDNSPETVARTIQNRKVASRFVFVAVLGIVAIVAMLVVYSGITQLYWVSYAATLPTSLAVL